MPKRPLGIDVLAAAKQRIATVFDAIDRVYLSFSGGKDSAVMMHLVCQEARRRGRTVGVLFIDLEAQYKLTIDHVQEMLDLYADVVEPYWVALPIALRNAVSVYEPKWLCWEPGAPWVRQPPDIAITDESRFPFFRRGMEFEEFTPLFGEWYAQGSPCACFVGIRADESLNRFRAIANQHKQTLDGHAWTTAAGSVYNCYPLYDWRTRDIWIYNARHQAPYNKLYDLMHQAGLSIHQQRICQPYGDDQRKGLWLYHVIEPETWAKVVARVAGANSGAEFVQFSGSVSGQVRVSKPDGHTWESFSRLLLESLPASMREHYEAKIFTFLQWYAARGYPDGIPDEADPKEEAARKAPSWRRIAKMLLRNDYWAKGLSFGQTRSEHYQRYLRRVKERMNEYARVDQAPPGQPGRMGGGR